jgi:hypothetical protein
MSGTCYDVPEFELPVFSAVIGKFLLAFGHNNERCAAAPHQYSPAMNRFVVCILKPKNLAFSHTL